MKNNKMLPYLRPVCASFALFGFVSMAFATENLPKPPSNKEEVQERFKAADTNADGKITLEEAQAGLPRVAMAWDKIDVDKKGYVTLDQLLIISAANR